MTKLHELAELGQSVWYDYIRRDFLNSGELEALIDQGLRGLTSNPSIFEKAIAHSTDYDQALQDLVRKTQSVQDIYESLVLEDIARAADLFEPVYTQTGGLDGYVSLEVSPHLAQDTENTVAKAKRLFTQLKRPNLMIKVPATRASLPAITELIGSGINVNVTLLFSVTRYQEVARAYLQGLEKLLAQGPSVSGGHNLDEVASVASFFVSRVDSAVDRELQGMGRQDLAGRAAVANAKRAYQKFLEIFQGPGWDSLREHGAGRQRLLWASTGTKNPDYPDTMYIDQLIGPNTVNTIPPDTLKSFLEHGTVLETLTKSMDEAEKHLQLLADLGIDLEKTAGKLLNDGILAFAQPYDALLAAIKYKRDQLS
jgi:transaldolase